MSSTVNKVATGNNHIVATGEIAWGAAQQFLVGKRADFLLAASSGAVACANDVEHVLAALRVIEVGLHALLSFAVRLEAVVFRPVVIGDDLEQVGHASELRSGVEELVRQHSRYCAVAAEHRVIEDNAGLFRRGLQQVVPAEGVAGPKILLVQWLRIRVLNSQWPIATTGDCPHLGTGKGIDLLHRAVGKRDERIAESLHKSKTTSLLAVGAPR